MSSESSKYLPLVEQYLRETIVLDVGSGGMPVVPHAIQVELSKESMRTYRGGEEPSPLIQIHGDDASFHLPFKSGTIRTCFSSHLIEDGSVEKQKLWLREWTRVLIPQTGHLVIFHPEKDRWHYATTVLGQCPNCSHDHIFTPGELSRMITDLRLPLQILEDRLSNLYEHDYNQILVAKRV